MFTNTYLPHVGGVAKSVATFTEDLRSMGHRVLVIAPSFDDQDAIDDPDIVRVPAVQNFNASDAEKLEEERRVHGITHEILGPVKAHGLGTVLDFYSTWRTPIDGLKTIA